MSSLSLGGLGIQSRSRSVVVLVLAALGLLLAGAGAMYLALQLAPEALAPEPAVAPPVPAADASAADLALEVGSPLPAGAETPTTDFVAGGARSRVESGGAHLDGAGRTDGTREPRPGPGSSAAPGGTAHAVGTSDRRDGGTQGRETPSTSTHGSNENPPSTGGTGTHASVDAGGVPSEPIPGEAVPDEQDLELELYGARVRFVVRRYYSARAQGCFDHATRNNVQLRGTVVVGFTIGADGQVTEAHSARNTTGDAALGACLANQVRTWRLPAPGEPLEFEMPFSR